MKSEKEQWHTGNPGHWRITGNEGNIPLIQTYRAEENQIVRHPSPLTLVMVDIKSQTQLVVDQYAPGDSIHIQADWEGPVQTEEQNPLQRHDCFELIFVLRGKIRVLIEDGDFRFSTGEAFLLNRFTRNAILYEEASLIACLCMSKDYWTNGLLRDEDVSFHHRQIARFFSTNMGSDFYDNRDYIEFRSLSQDSLARASLLLMAIRNELDKRAPGYAMIARGLTLRFLTFMDDPSIYKATYVSLGPSRDRDVVEELRAYLESHPRRLTRTEISTEFHFSEGYLALIFKRFTGQTIADYNRHIYLREARRLLRETELSISSVAEQVGFVNRTHFYRIYIEEFGETPHETRTGFSEGL